MSKPKPDKSQEGVTSEQVTTQEEIVIMQGLRDLYIRIFVEAYSKSGRVLKAQQEAADACEAMREYFGSSGAGYMAS